MDIINPKSIFGATRFHLAPRSPLPAPRRAFTLVELLVVITIIGILASLITVAAVAALKNAQQTRIKVELGQIATGLEEYKNKVTAYPPNLQTDGTGANAPLDEAQVFQDLKKHLKQIAPRNNEPDELLQKLAGLGAAPQLAGGMTAGEAVVFWLSGFSSDPKYPISGEGGPSYSVQGVAATDRAKADNVSSRNWIYPFEVTRLGPRADDDYFDQSTNRFIEYTVNTGNGAELRRINFWQYTPAKSEEPFLYFDTSRHPAYDIANAVPARFDPPAATELTGLGPNGEGLHVHALKKRSDAAGTNVAQIQFVEPERFQVLHCGNDGAWGIDEFERMSVHDVNTNNADDYLLFPNGPFTGEVADTVANFASQNKIEDAQP
jgi:prepilin-type N-terminal cleavage/methylation domain-containing protein